MAHRFIRAVVQRFPAPRLEGLRLGRYELLVTLTLLQAAKFLFERHQIRGQNLLAFLASPVRVAGIEPEAGGKHAFLLSALSSLLMDVLRIIG